MSTSPLPVIPTPPDQELPPAAAEKVIVSHAPRVTRHRRKLLYLAAAALLLSLLTLILVPLGFAYWYLSSFTQAAGVTNTEILDSLKVGFTAPVARAQAPTNFLILGVDGITGQKEGSLLTDTLLVASVDPAASRVSLLSLPRDLWINKYKTKVNSLYYYGELNPDTTGVGFTRETLEEVLGQTLDYTFVVKLDTLRDVIDTLGGVEINVLQGFTDDKFPRDNVDVTVVSDPQLLYETVVFSPGPQHMDGATALKYIRSRQSQDLDQGNDLARGQRQQQLINAIITRVKTREVLANPHLLGNLYRIYLTQIQTDLSLTAIIGLARSLHGQPPAISSIPLPIQDPQTPGIIFHPPQDKYDQWVYEPLDPTWQELHLYLAGRLANPD